MKTISNFAFLRRAALLLLLALAAGAPPARAANAEPPDRLTYQGFVVDANGLALGNDAPKSYDVVFRIFDGSSGGTRLWSEQQTITVDKGYFSVLLGEGAAVGTEARPVLSTLFANQTASARYVEITVKGIGPGGADSTIVPRLRLLTVPYAFLAKQASQLVDSTGSTYLSRSGSTVSINGTVSATSFSGNGAGVASLNADNISSGTLSDARHSSNVPLKNGANTFSGNNTFSSSGNSFAGYGTIPLGGIIMWSGSTSSLPTGWSLCDGGTYNGRTTPDLRGKFVLGYQSGSYNIGGTGGASSKSLSTSEMPSHSHSVDPPNTTTTSNTHDHKIAGYTADGVGPKGAGTSYDYVLYNADGTYQDPPNRLTSSHTHSHDVNISSFTSGSTGSGNSFSIMPPYYVLAFIMRVQ
ncbi:MAG: tail fiber protein [Chloroflexi bacterium]|nr:tail fiber protein [Chloroflexota bacterium]